MTSKHLEVIVVGGSLGGLFAGVALKHAGHNVRILERTPSALLHDQGAGILCGGETQAFFAEHDRTQTPLAVRVPYRHYLDKEGNEIHREDMKQQMTSWDLLWNLLRANFHSQANEYCEAPPEKTTDGSASYENGCTVKDVRESGDGRVEVVFTTVDGIESVAPADIVIGADGPSSTIRKIFEPSVVREYAGYVAIRGTALETELSPAASEALVDKFTFFHAPSIQALAYVIPGNLGSLEKGHRLVNWLFYDNYLPDSPELDKLLTDSDGKRHNVTLPVGKMQESVWETLKQRADDILPPQLAEVVRKTKHPFVQAITDVISPRNSFLDGKVLLIGDALAGFRPHTAASTSQAAYDSQLLVKNLSGALSQADWEQMTMKFARETQARGVMMGNRSQFGTPFRPELMGPGAPRDIGRVGQPN